MVQTTYTGVNWTASSNTEIFDVFLVMRQLHEMLGYLTDVSLQELSASLQKEMGDMRLKIDSLTHLDPSAILGLNMNYIAMR